MVQWKKRLIIVRVCLAFASENGQKTLLPVHYNHLIHSLVYRVLSEKLARDLHEEGVSL